LLTRYSPARVETGEMLSVSDVEEVLGLKTIGVIPESTDVLNASNKGEPVILAQESGAGQAYEDAVARLLGEERPMRFTQLEKKAFFSKLFGGRRNGTVRHPEDQEEHCVDRQRAIANHRGPGAQQPRRPGLPAA